MSRKVLVVDDEKLIVKGLRFSLEQDDMEVACAALTSAILAVRASSVSTMPTVLASLFAIK